MAKRTMEELLAEIEREVTEWLDKNVVGARTLGDLVQEWNEEPLARRIEIAEFLLRRPLPRSLLDARFEYDEEPLDPNRTIRVFLKPSEPVQVVYCTVTVE